MILRWTLAKYGNLTWGNFYTFMATRPCRPPQGSSEREHFETGTRLMPRFAPAALSSEGKGHFYLVPWDDHYLFHPSLPFPAFSYFFLPCRVLTIFIVKLRRALTVFIFKSRRALTVFIVKSRRTLTVFIVKYTGRP